MYIIKIKGKAKIADFIQLRDDDFILVGYFRADRPLRDLEKYKLEEHKESLQTLINELPFGKLTKLDF